MENLEPVLRALGKLLWQGLCTPRKTMKHDLNLLLATRSPWNSETYILVKPTMRNGVPLTHNSFVLNLSLLDAWRHPMNSSARLRQNFKACLMSAITREEHGINFKVDSKRITYCITSHSLPLDETRFSKLNRKMYSLETLEIFRAWFILNKQHHMIPLPSLPVGPANGCKKHGWTGQFEDGA